MFCLSEQGHAGLEKFFCYAISLDRIPPLGLSRKVEVEFSINRNPASFAETCNMVSKVPTVLKISRKSFYKRARIILVMVLFNCAVM